MTERISAVQNSATQTVQKKADAGPVNKHTFLKYGSKGPEVKELQRLLQDRGFYKGPVSGTMDSASVAAVKDFQKANGLQVDGLVGQQTWGAFNGDRFPPGSWMLKKPVGGHSGNSGFDTPGVPPTSINVDTRPPEGNTSAEKILDTARRYIGLREGAGNANPFSKALGRPSEAWCADFVSFCAKASGGKLNTASAQGVQDYLTKQGTWKGRNNPQPGDAITFDWAGRNGWADHVGLVEKVFQRNGKIYVQTIEGNSSDQVRRKTYAIDDPVIKGFGRIV